VCLRLGECCIRSCSGGFLLTLLEFGDPYGILSLIRTRVRSLLCAEFWIGNVPGFLYWTQKRWPRVVFLRSRLTWILLCRQIKTLLLVESFDLWPSSQYILVRVMTGCFHFVKISLCQVSLLLRSS
jgi:hypothetical protein